MRRNIILLFLVATSLTACRTTPPQPVVSSGSLEAIQKRAADFNSIISVPWFEATSGEIRDTVTNTIRRGNARLDRIGRLGSEQVTFGNTVRALDDEAFRLRCRSTGFR